MWRFSEDFAEVQDEAGQIVARVAPEVDWHDADDTTRARVTEAGTMLAGAPAMLAVLQVLEPLARLHHRSDVPPAQPEPAHAAHCPGCHILAQARAVVAEATGATRADMTTARCSTCWHPSADHGFYGCQRGGCWCRWMGED